MNSNEILATIDKEIARLEQARAVLASLSSNIVPASVKPAARKRRTMSKEARKRIAEAQRKRWAAQRASK